MNEVQLVDFALVMAMIPVLTGIGELLKKTFKRLDGDYLPMILAILGVLLCLGWVWSHPSTAPTEGRWGVAALTGLVSALTASHLYDAVKTFTVAHNGKSKTDPPEEKRL